ncbi:MAG: thioredoxin family protein [Alphaproteobacteria bacterium]|nr:thioredoxin family protein [Alphaproteobacteria bacterium]
MIEVKIYCMRSNEGYQKTYNAIKKVMIDNNLEHIILRIDDSNIIKRRNIKNQPLIVINNLVVFLGTIPTPHEVKLILIRMKLI